MGWKCTDSSLFFTISHITHYPIVSGTIMSALCAHEIKHSSTYNHRNFCVHIYYLTTTPKLSTTVIHWYNYTSTTVLKLSITRISTTRLLSLVINNTHIYYLHLLSSGHQQYITTTQPPSSSVSTAQSLFTVIDNTHICRLRLLSSGASTVQLLSSGHRQCAYMQSRITTPRPLW